MLLSNFAEELKLQNRSAGFRFSFKFDSPGSQISVSVLLGCFNRQLPGSYPADGTCVSEGNEIPRDLRKGDQRQA